MTTSNLAQRKVSERPERPVGPGPELDRLDAFVGTWNMEGQQYDGPFGPAAKISAIETYEWLIGGFFLVHRLGGRLDAAEIACLEIIGYDDSTRSYTRYSFYNNGKTNQWQEGETETDGTWTLVGDSQIEAKTLKVRCTTVFGDSGKQMTAKWEYSSDGSNWQTFWDVKATRAS